MTSLSDGKKSKIISVLLVICIFFSAASGYINETALSTVATYILGNSIEQFTIIIALMLLAMGVGGNFQKYIPSKYLVESFIIAECILAIVSGWAPISAWWAFSVMQAHFNVVLYGLAFSIGFLIGLEVPVIIRINDGFSRDLKSNLADVLSYDYVGSFVGAILFAWYLLYNFALTEMSFLVAGINLFVAIFAFTCFWLFGFIKKPVLCFVFVVLAIGLSVSGYVSNDQYAKLLKQRFYDDPIQETVRTAVQDLTLTKNSETGDIRLYINGNTQFSSMDETRYHEIMTHAPAMIAPHIKNVLVLGGGDGLLVKRLLQYDEIENITLVDLDPGMVEFARSNPLLRELNGDAFYHAKIENKSGMGVTKEGWRELYLESKEVDQNGKEIIITDNSDTSLRVIHIDADRFLDDISKTAWDLIYIDFPDPSAIELAKLYSQEFYIKLARIISPDAMVMIQSTSPYHAKDAFLTIGKTLQHSGYNTVPLRINIPSFGEWGFWMASPTWTEMRMKNALKSNDLKVKTEWLTEEIIKASLAFGKGDLDMTYIEINTLMRPVLFEKYHRQGWQGE